MTDYKYLLYEAKHEIRKLKEELNEANKEKKGIILNFVKVRKSLEDLQGAYDILLKKNNRLREQKPVFNFPKIRCDYCHKTLEFNKGHVCKKQRGRK